ncbi:M28 family peptidase [Pseudactinotalea sp.]|uniref:M28 family peptidase n=1 Tax=Pseudactinotalea sp. TaxID=1926260 RepID=UPI003B3AFFB1
MNADDSVAAPGTATRGRVSVCVVVLALLAAVLAGFASRGTAAPLGGTAPAADFSAARATAMVAPVVQDPRPIGSPENAEARRYLAEQLQAAGFDVQEHDGIAARTGTGDYAGESTAAFVRNLVATRPGSDPTGTVVLATHIDSVPGAPGAADAGVGLAVILETVRALGDEALRNDLVVLLVDGEEDGLLGALDYLQAEAGDLAEPVVVLNHEARGVSGRPMVTRWSGPMHQAMPAMPSPEAESFTDALFAIIPNDTDFTEYRNAGWWGMDLAITGDSWAYHSPQDDAAHLDPSTLQHYGELTLGLTRDLLDRDLLALDDAAAEPVLTTAPWGILQIPAGVLLALAVLAPVAALAGIGLASRRRLASWGRSLLGVLGSVVAVLLGGALAVGTWMLAQALRPGMLSVTVGEPVTAWPFLAAEAATAVAALAIVWALLRRRVGTTALALCATLTASLLAAALTAYSPQLGGWLMLPVAVAALGTPLAIALLAGEPSRARRATATVVRVVAALPMGWVLGTQLSAMGEFGIASSNGMLAIVVLVSLLAVAGLWAPGGQAMHAASESGARSAPRMRGRVLLPATTILAVLSLTGVGLAVQDAAAEPTQERVVAEVDVDAGTALWSATGSTAWGRDLDGVSVADTASLSPPECVATTVGDGRVSITVSSPRESQRLMLAVAEDSMTDISVDGTPVATGTEGSTVLRVLGLEPGQSAVVEATTAATSLICTDETHNPADAPGWQPEPDDVSLVQPAVRVTATVTLDDTP